MTDVTDYPEPSPLRGHIERNFKAIRAKRRTQLKVGDPVIYVIPESRYRGVVIEVNGDTVMIRLKESATTVQTASEYVIPRKESPDGKVERKEHGTARPVDPNPRSENKTPSVPTRSLWGTRKKDT